MNGVVFQTSTMTTADSAVSGSAVQAIGSAISAERQQEVVDDAEQVVEHPAHICAETTVGIAQGISTAARSEAAAGNVRVEDQRDDEAEHRLDRRPRRAVNQTCSRPRATSRGRQRRATRRLGE